MSSIARSIQSFILALWLTPAFAAESPSDVPSARLLNFDSPERILGRYLVKFKSEEELSDVRPHDLRAAEMPSVLPVTAEDVRVLATGLAQKTRTTLTHTFRNSVKGFALGNVSEQAITEIARDPRVDYIEPVMKVHLQTTQGTPSQPAPWHLDRIDQRQLPLDSTYSYNWNGSDVDVYVLDTGIWYTHNGFQGRAWNKVYDCVVPAGYSQNCRIRDASNNVNMDCKGHGTQVAGIIGSATYGVAKSVNLRGFIVTHSANDSLSCNDEGDTADQIAAFDEIENRAQDTSDTIVVNYSVGANVVVNSLEDAIRGAINDGVVVVVAAGNSNANACNSTPSRMPEVITVAASTEADSRLSTSDYGPCVDVFAPGSNMSSTDRGGNSNTAHGLTGTSVATAVVTGIVALYLQQYRTATPTQVRQAIVGGATPGILSNIATGSPNLLVNMGGTMGEAPPGAGAQQRIRTVIGILNHLLLTGE